MTTTNTAATKTQRRTAKIAKPYTAALFRVYDKASGVCLGYLSPSENGKDRYEITCDDLGTWHCTCLGNKKYHRRCQHIKAACELCEIRVKQGRPACRAASLPVVEETSDADKELLAIVVNAMVASSSAEPAVRELRNVTIAGDLAPQYRDEDGAWQHFKDEQGHDIRFIGGYEDLARKFIAVDSDEHRQAVRAELQQMIEDFVAAEDARDLVAVAQSQAAKASDAVDVLMAASAAQSERRMAAPINGSRRIGFAPIVAPVLAVGRVVPMR